ncbi:hypothetical protein EYF80_066055 [Liparis tanakae]|uniref:Uncharacterized protein n=1 Tax=Liparis tanakae TaxID=230148 RepID=A0A4Z2E591_9TELE|nr:hypothetical protein EYF80_066055 [Liparis tanakae]
MDADRNGCPPSPLHPSTPPLSPSSSLLQVRGPFAVDPGDLSYSFGSFRPTGSAPSGREAFIGGKMSAVKKHIRRPAMTPTLWPSAALLNALNHSASLRGNEWNEMEERREEEKVGRPSSSVGTLFTLWAETSVKSRQRK